MVDFIQFDLNVHREVFVQLNIELVTWIADQFKENYQLDAASMIGQTVPEYVNAHLQELTNLKPPDGIIYLLVAEGDIVGMGGLRKLSDEVGEIKRMYICPQHRGRGYGKQMLNHLLDVGRELGCTTFCLETSKFMTAAHHIYKSAGFVERGEYPESETPPVLRPYQLYLEKKK